jgi:hypothetical protein
VFRYQIGDGPAQEYTAGVYVVLVRQPGEPEARPA